MSDAAKYYDNAAMESWFDIMTRERVNRRSDGIWADDRPEIFNCIERFYSRFSPLGLADR